MSSGACGRALRGAPRRALLAPAQRRFFETQKAAAASRLPDPKSARSTEFPLMRRAVRKMAADYKSAATLEISCNVEAAPPEGHIIHEQAPFACEGCLWLQAAGLVGRRLIANHAKTQKPAAAESACRQYRVVRWFLLPEGELRRRLGQSSGLQILLNNEPQRRNSPVRLSGQAATSSTLPHTTMRPPALPPPGPMSMM